MVFELPDLWSVMVESVFGGFWISVFGLAGVMGLIMMIGGISAFTIGTYCMVFILVMALGYGQPLIAIPLLSALWIWSAYEFVKFINHGSY